MSINIENLIRNEIFVMCKNARRAGYDYIVVKTIWISRKLERLGIPIKAINPLWSKIIDGACINRKKAGVLVINCYCFS